MFLRHNKRIKDGKTHRYWSVVENRRIAGGRSVQKTLLYLGEINDSEHASWTRAIAAIHHNNQTQQIHLFPADRTPSAQLTNPTLKPASTASNLPPTTMGRMLDRHGTLGSPQPRCLLATMTPRFPQRHPMAQSPQNPRRLPTATTR